MTGSTRFRVKAPDVVNETIEGETVIVHLNTGNYYSLQGVAADIWRLVEAGAALGRIVELISQAYQGDPQDMREGVNQFIARLQTEDLIEPDQLTQADGLNPGLAPAAGAAKKDFKMPVLEVHNDMQELLLIDPIHEVDETGWPNTGATPGQ